MYYSMPLLGEDRIWQLQKYLLVTHLNDFIIG